MESKQRSGRFWQGVVLDGSQELLGPLRFSRYETRRPRPTSNPPSRREKRRNS
jgi:hypothetical protein